MNVKNAPLALAALAALMTLCGCGSVPAIKYYTLTAPTAPPVAANASVLPVTLAVGPIRASQLYRDNRVIYATSNEELGTYDYERWAQPAPLMVHEVILRALRASGRYQMVEGLASNSRPNFILRGSLYDFNEVSGTPLEARVTLQMELRDAKTGEIVWNHYYTHDQAVSEAKVSSVVAALNQNVQQAIAEINSSLSQFLGQYLESHPRQQ